MPEEGVDLTDKSQLMSNEDIERLVRLFAYAGVSKVRLTGGEPTLRKDLPELVGMIKRVDGIKDVGITTNGIMLHKMIDNLRINGLSLINISLDSLKPDRFEQMTRRKGLGRVLSAVDRALELGFEPVKLNVVVMNGVNDDEIPDFIELTRNKNINVSFCGRYCLNLGA